MANAWLARRVKPAIAERSGGTLSLSCIATSNPILMLTGVSSWLTGVDELFLASRASSTTGTAAKTTAPT
jgi:hypothetical protein